MKPNVRGTRKGILWAIILLSSFVFFMFVVLFSYRAGDLGPLSDIFMQYHFYLMMMLGALGVAVGAIVFYFMSQKVEHVQANAKVNAEVVLRFLSRDEQLVVRKLIEEKGKALQAEISRLPDMNKVKAHRVLQKLSEKQVITLEQYGKTKTVKLKPEIYEALA